jgi:uncharacterized protein (TIGR02145 family)
MKYFSDILSEVFTWCHTVVAAPTELILTADCPNFILNWTSNSTNETGFVIQRSYDGNTWNNLDTVGAGVYTYTDTTGIPDILYYYRVYAFNATEISGYSNVESINCDFTDIKYGLLYNWFVASDVRNIANTDWSVAIKDDFEALMLFIDPAGDAFANSAGEDLKTIGTTYWNNALGLDTYGFNGKGAGLRSHVNGLFSDEKVICEFWNNNEFTPDSGIMSELRSDTSYFMTSALGTEWGNNKNVGASIRLIKDDANDPGIYIGNDGKRYPTIKINNQVWVAQNLAETKYRDGSVIPEEQNAVAWTALATGAWCYYDNDPNNM